MFRDKRKTSKKTLLSSIYKIYDSILEERHWRKFSSKINDSILKEDNKSIYIETTIL